MDRKKPEKTFTNTQNNNKIIIINTSGLKVHTVHSTSCNYWQQDDQKIPFLSGFSHLNRTKLSHIIHRESLKGHELTVVITVITEITVTFKFKTEPSSRAQHYLLYYFATPEFSVPSTV